MAKFKPGQPKSPNSGRKRGVKNRKKLIPVEEILATANFNPAEELMKVLPTLDPLDKAKILLQLLDYYCPKVKPIEVPAPAPEPDPAKETLKNTDTAQLVSLIKAQ